jgi:hypothetical protein
MIQNQNVGNQTGRTSRPANPQNREARPKQQQQQKRPKRGPGGKKKMEWRPVSDRPIPTNFSNRNVKRSNLTSNFGSKTDFKRLPPFTEQISQPLSSANWALFKSYSINPGQKAYFPVASNECLQWQKYRFRRFHVVYEPFVNEYNTNNDGAGEIIISFDPDASDQPPTTFQQAINVKPIARGRPCDKIILVVPPHLLQGMKDAFFVRHGTLPGGSDIKTYDVGLINISVVGSGTTGSTTLGNIFFEYELDLYCQQIQLNTAAPANNQVAFFQSTSAQTFTTTVPTISLNATSVTNGISAVNTAGSVVLPPGNYLVSYGIAGVDATSGEPFYVTLDFQKNGTSVLTAPLIAGDVNQHVTLSAGVFVSSNGTDAFQEVVTMLGTTGPLTGTSWMVFTSV